MTYVQMRLRAHFSDFPKQPYCCHTRSPGPPSLPGTLDSSPSAAHVSFPFPFLLKLSLSSFSAQDINNTHC